MTSETGRKDAIYRRKLENLVPLALNRDLRRSRSSKSARFPMKPQIKLFAALLCPLALPIYTATAAPSLYNDSPFGAGSLLCMDGQCEAAIVKTTYQNRPAYKLSNGAVDAIVVPEIGRVMSFGKTGGPNLIWNAPSEKIAKTGWKNYGGDKTWLAPQSNWKQFHGADNWPPDAAFDGQAQKPDVLTGGKLQLTTPLSPTGIRIVRTMYFDEDGEFVIEQTARKESGAPVKASLWNVTQVVPGQAVFAPVNPNSTYPNGIYVWDGKTVANAESVAPGLIKIVPSADGNTPKIGFDAPVAALASMHDGVAWLQKSDRPDGEYPDGKNGVGFPLETYINGTPETYYQELEFLGPLQELKIGDSQTKTVRWSLHALPSTDANAPEVVAAMQKLLSPTPTLTPAN